MSGAGVALRRAGRLLPARLSGKLLLFGTVVTIIAVAAAFLVLSVEIRRQSRAHLVDLLRENQTTVRNLQARTRDELLWTSRLMTLSPTLRAAMETYRDETSTDDTVRRDLVETVQVEVERIRRMLGRDLILITDDDGKVLAASAAADAGIAHGTDLSRLPLVRHALLPPADGAPSNFAVLQTASGRFQAGAVPIVLQGYVIGTLTLAERIDAEYLRGLGTALSCDVLLLLDGRVQDSTLPETRRALLSDEMARTLVAETGRAEPIRLHGEEYVTASLPLGEDEAARPATLVLMRSLTRSLAPANRSLVLSMLACGALAVLLSVVAAWGVSRSVLGPLERFVSFMKSVAADKDHSRRFDGPTESAEIRILDDAYSHLMASLQERELLLLLHAREEMVRVERLKETEKLASLGRMLSGAAHEINNPLTGVVGNIDLLFMAGRIEGKDRDMLEKVRREARRIAGLVKNLLKAAHRDTGERTLVDLNQLLRETVALREHDFTRSGIALRLEPSGGTIPLLVNELEIQQVFLNVINNAFDALIEYPQGEPGRAVTLRAEEQDGSAIVTIADNGPGMKDPRKVFDHFYTTKPVGKGTGLGLSITHASVTGHGGTITASNLPTRGACFTITLPTATIGGAPREAAATAREEAVSVEAPGPISASWILVVEDEPEILEVQQTILGSIGATVVGAASGEEALEWLQVREPDLIVTDLIMPGKISGQGLFHWVESNRPEWTSRFVFVTGDTANEMTRGFLDSTRCPFLMKPFTAEEYAKVIRGALETLRVSA